MHLSRILTSKILATVLSFAVFTLSASAKTPALQSDSGRHEVPGEHAGGHGEEKFDAAAAIMHHIADAHEWHIIGHTAIYLPVILYTDNGLEIFSSSHFYHNPRTVTYSADGKEHTATWYSHKGFALFHEKVYKLDENGSLSFDEDGHPLNERVMDFSITKNVASMFVSVALLLLIFGSVAKAYRKRKGKAPKGLQSALEPIVLFVRDDIAQPNIGHQYRRFMPFLLTVFFFIWINNVMGLIPFFPGGANVSGNIAFTFVMGTITFLITTANGNKNYWKHIFAPNVPVWLYPIMIPVEIISVFSKPFALIIRLFANITAGHIVVLSLVSLIFIFKTVYVSPVSVAFVLFMDVLELLVGFLQAYIFTLLSALFIGMAVAEHAEH